MPAVRRAEAGRRRGPSWPSPMPRSRLALTLAAERRKPQVTVRQLLVARVEEGVVKYDFTFFYNVLYSGVKSLRIDVPAEVAARPARRHARRHEKAIDPPPADLAKG